MKLSSAWSSPSIVAALLSFSFISPTVLAVGGTSPASTLFSIPSASEDGNCDNYNVDQVISDASKMAQAAITAITNYQKQSFFSAPAPGVVATHFAAWSMFGVPGTYAEFINRVSVSSSGSAILDNVKKNYQNVINLLQSTSKLMNGAKPAVLACDDKFLTWVTQLQDINPNLKGQPGGDQTLLSLYAERGTTFASSVQGFYYSNWQNANIMLQDEGVRKPDGSAGGALCTDGTMDAETWSKYGFMLCCPRMFQLPSNVAAVVGSAGGTPTGTHIDTFKTAAGAFLHEMMHFLDTNTATNAKITDQEINDQKAYQWEQCSLLGTNLPNLALLNADSYHYFAVAATLSGVNFGTEGVAQ